jgi:anti-anti-sigma factor
MNDLLSPEQTVEKLFLTGRIDSITCREIEALFRNAIMGGKRLIVADMTAVSYVSSAGLRVFLSVQKELKKGGGEVCFLGCPSTVHSIFEISGFTKIFRFLSTGDDIARFLRSPGGDAEIREVPFDHAVLRVLSRTASAGSLTLIGSEEKLPSASYGEGDVVSVRAADMRFAAGFAALGHSFEDYKGYFGETIVLDGNIFVYPALRRSAVDFIVHTEGEMDTVYHFLHASPSRETSPTSSPSSPREITSSRLTPLSKRPHRIVLTRDRHYGHLREQGPLRHAPQEDPPRGDTRPRRRRYLLGKELLRMGRLFHRARGHL